MRMFIVVLMLLVPALCFAGQVKGYTRSDGTYVSSYQRSSPNSTVTDNWSYEGNSNPFTGSEGHNHYRQSPSSEYYDPFSSLNQKSMFDD